MHHINKLPGLNGRGSSRRFWIALTIYVSLLACVGLVTLGVIIDAFTDSETETETVAENPTPTAASEPAGVPIVTGTGKRYIDDAVTFRDELDEMVSRVESGDMDEAEFGRWSAEWNEHRQHLYDECQDADTGILACVPLHEVRTVWNAEQARLFRDGDEQTVASARNQLDETLNEVLDS
jgi:hypothetical protein